MDWIAIGLSLRLALCTTLALCLLGLPLAYWLANRRRRWKVLVEGVVALPLVLPPTVLGFYLLSAFSPVSWFGAVLKSIFGVSLVFSFPGILVASVIINLPFAVQPIQRAFEAIAPNVREAAFVSGLSPLRTMRFVELPLAWPGIVSALALVIAHTLGEFGVILMIGGSIPGETRVLSIAIYDRVQDFRNDEAAVMSAVLLGVSLVAIALVHMMARRRRADFHDA